VIAVTAALRIGLRTVAIAIAVVALVDPVFSVDRVANSRVALIDMTNGSLDRVRQALSNRGADITERAPRGFRIPCAPSEHCVIVADGTVGAELPADVHEPVLFVDARAAAPNVRLLSATVTRPHLLAASTVRVAIEGQGVSARETAVRVADGDVTVGSLRHQWTGDGTVHLDVPWWPLASGPRALRITATTDLDETSLADNAIDLGAQIEADRLPVLVFDSRPSWNSTFVRRALEDDPRFLVEHRARVAPAIATATPSGRLDARALDLAGVLIVGAPEGLSDSEAALIDRFVGVRSGTAILLPEREPSGPMLRLLSTDWSEHLAAEPQRIGALHATEILQTRHLPVGSVVLGSYGDRAAIVHTPKGAGAVLVSGAMDAWRYREQDARAFDRFWRSMIANAAVDSRRLDIEFGNEPASRGMRRQFRARVRSMQPPGLIDATAIARCGPSTNHIRLWPAGPPAVFTGEVAIASQDSCEVEISVGELIATAGVAVVETPAASTSRTLAELEAEITSAGGSTTRVDADASLNVFNAPPQRERVAIHPMRSVWWMLPFVGCLSVEWWLRRRHGLK
jgi:hypothetical protein